MKPSLQFSILCDDVRREDNGKFMLIGLFEVIHLPGFPSAYPALHVVNRWFGGEGRYRQQVRLMSPDNTVVAQVPASEVVLPDTNASVTALNVFIQVPFEKQGRYWIEVLLGDDLVQRYPLMVREAPRPPLP
jgi:hypothetical protein